MKLNLVDDCAHWWHLWSNRLALAAGAMVAAVIADPTIPAQFIALVPPEWRPLAGAVAGLLTTSIAIGTRMSKQPKLEEKRAAAAEKGGG